MKRDDARRCGEYRQAGGAAAFGRHGHRNHTTRRRDFSRIQVQEFETVLRIAPEISLHGQQRELTLPQ
jgi:hypothetical protein